MAKDTQIKMCVDVFPPAGSEEYLADIARHEDPTNVISGLRQMFAPNQAMPARIASITAKKWANGRTISISFIGGTSAQQQFVADTASKWCQFANVKFEWGVSAAQSDVRIAFSKGEGAYSYIGTDCLGIPKNKKTMNLGWLDEAVVLHEFGHMLSCIHEHQHPKNGIPWNKAAVYKYYSGAPNYWDKPTIDSNIFGAYSVSQTQFSAYDKKSIMHYAIDAKLLTDPSYAVGWNNNLSGSDMDFMAKLYPKADAPQPPVKEHMEARVAFGGKIYAGVLEEETD